MTKKELNPNVALIALAGAFAAAYLVPWDAPRVSHAVQEAFLMLGSYAREHVLLCLVPAMFIAGAIGVFLNQQSVMRYLGPRAPKALAYGVASVSGAILAVCSCTVLPLFKGIYKKGAGLGPAISFLYSGPAISVIAITMSFQVFGWKIGLARTIGAISFAVIIGLLMQIIFRKEDEARLADERLFTHPASEGSRRLWQTAVYLGSMIGILVFVNWASSKGNSAAWDSVYRAKYFITGAFALALAYAIVRWFKRDELAEWGAATRDFAIQILPLLFGGVLVSGFLLGRPGQEALIPNAWIVALVGCNSLAANLVAAVSGALMYFATLTEVPIVQGLLGSGMGEGPALALLLAGPSLSLPSMLVIAGELGAKKTACYVALVVAMSTLAGMLFGSIA
ncbi:MAG TPA: permease [Treponemataceae bacterium]|nr:permease [Treponemataceae bacterium]